MGLFDVIFRLNYSANLHERLKGMTAEGEGYTSPSIYQLVLILIVIISTINVINHYFGILNQPSFGKVRTWGANVLVVSVAVGFLAYTFAAADISACQEAAALSFSRTDCVLFAITAFAYNVCYCLVLSLALKATMTIRRIYVPELEPAILK